MHRPEWYRGNIPWLLAIRGVRSFSQSMLVIVVPLYAAAAGYSTVQVGLLLSIAMAGAVVMTIGVGFLSDRFGRKPLLLAISALSTIGASVFPFTTEFWILAIMSALTSIRGGGAGSGGGFGPFYPAEQALVAESSSDSNRNAVFSSLSLVGVLTGAAGSLLAGLPHILQMSLHFSASQLFPAGLLDCGFVFFCHHTSNLTDSRKTSKIPIKQTRKTGSTPHPAANRTFVDNQWD